MHCGQHAINEIMQRHDRSVYSVSDLDALTVEVHELERARCPDGRDTESHPDGYYPVETLLLAMRRKGLRSRFLRTTASVASGEYVKAPDGYLVGTGNHYVAIVPGREDNFELWDGGQRVRSAHSACALLHASNVKPVMIVAFYRRRK